MAVTKDELWDAYISNIPEESRQEYNCNCCKQFIKSYGNVAALVEGQILTLWGINIDNPVFKDSVKALQELVLNSEVHSLFISPTCKLGTDSNASMGEDGEVHIWHHFFLSLPQSAASVASQTTRNVFSRGMIELSAAAAVTVLGLIDSNELYRGAEVKHRVAKFIQHKRAYDSLTEAKSKSVFCWENYLEGGKMWGTSIGTLIKDITDGMPAQQAVKRFEIMVAPANYKRPTALVTHRMLSNAKEEVQALGYEKSLERRFAIPDDIPVSEVIYTDRSHDPLAQTNIFDEVGEDLPVNPKKHSHGGSLTIAEFLADVLPKADSIEILLECKHAENLVTLVAPTNADSPSMFPWDNGLSWAYSGGMADSMKKRVKDAGGRVDGVLRFSIQWNEGMKDNNQDFDAHCLEPDGTLISYPTAGEVQRSSGMLDVDNTSPDHEIAVENIIWTDQERMPKGDYKLLVHNYSNYNSVEGFQAEIEFGGVTHTFAYNKPMMGEEKVIVASVKLDEYGHFTITPSLPEGGSEITTRKMWGIGTNKFHKVATLMKSPNHWGNNMCGNEHTFFLIDSCKAEESPRGIFNEFLKPELHEHRKVFETLANKIVVKPLDKGERELSGLGFSSTQRNEVILRVSGVIYRVTF